MTLLRPLTVADVLKAANGRLFSDTVGGEADFRFLHISTDSSNYTLCEIKTSLESF